MVKTLPKSIILVLCFSLIFCYPLKRDLDLKLDKNEKHYPNGTIVGKYSYTDKEGNPIQVKYYADDASYGVELKSLKVVGTSDNPQMQDYELPNVNGVSSTPSPLWTFPDLSTNTKYKSKNSDPMLKKEYMKPYKADVLSPEYEIYFQKEFKPQKKCGKVRVYLEKEKRKVRDASRAQAIEYCNQY